MQSSKKISSELDDLMKGGTPIEMPNNLLVSENLLSTGSVKVKNSKKPSGIKGYMFPEGIGTDKTTEQSTLFFQNPTLKSCFHVLWIEFRENRKERGMILVSDEDARRIREFINDPTQFNFHYNFSLHTLSGESADTLKDTAIPSDLDWEIRPDSFLVI